MNTTTVATFPTADICEKARLSRDARFDGVFFTAVLSTRIYCRPVCPARPPKVENVRYYPSAAAAEALGFRPCLRCRPELAPGNSVWLHGEHRVARALKLIHEGFLAEHSLDELAARLDVGGRQLRRLFVQHLGAPPIAVHATQRLLFARQLLSETTLSITEVALASGFQSLRRFNSAFADANHVAPRELRRQPNASGSNALVLRLGYRPPYDFKALLVFLAGRALPGIEVVEEQSYRRVFGRAESPGWLRVSPWPAGGHALKLELFNVTPAQMLPVVTRIRRMFDLDADPQAIVASLGASPVLASLVERYPGQRLPGGWDGFEISVRAVLGQQVSVAAARTLATRLLTRFTSVLETPAGPGLDRLFPTPEQLLDADLEVIGVIRTRAATIRGIAQALLDGRVSFGTEQRLDDFVRSWVALPGIGEWTAHYIAMRVLNHPDAFPAADLILRREVVEKGSPLSTKALEVLAENWRPWRAYSVMYLWRAAVESEWIRRSLK
ncbi:DNA methylase [Pseudomonas agarici]|uniref:DNA-3-methyladenine glycosylase II n=1 Tax=Pseudomonas agarici TaxID=46677 RepID=A0A0X1T429_PSEAA|nr:DNA-3-methyladenine glycosylase 2 [Pseudomonas agarici]AMB86771.1 DNA methylase [Pseudomonas agarici]NWB90784.1 DNA-3-methyladenine glycosylase 2 family protein [Pseudomonas agarici]NWC08578.1 DNA-3-methyladenine glycosylase 2 family protein [Pseudomonas agarici]SEL25152.1 DNA-3-methyladenine glycosylase II [Pseudomonas agarici]